MTAGAGFLAAVLWFDLMHDVQVFRRPGDLPDEVLASISRYYRRVTTDARPMNRLVAAAMLATLVAIVVQIAAGDAPVWLAWTALVLAVLPIGLAAGRTVPRAVRLGRGADTVEVRSGLARSVFRDHLCCLGSIGLLLVLEVGFGR